MQNKIKKEFLKYFKNNKDYIPAIDRYINNYYNDYIDDYINDVNDFNDIEIEVGELLAIQKIKKMLEIEKLEKILNKRYKDFGEIYFLDFDGIEKREDKGYFVLDYPGYLSRHVSDYKLKLLCKFFIKNKKLLNGSDIYIGDYFIKN